MAADGTLGFPSKGPHPRFVPSALSPALYPPPTVIHFQLPLPLSRHLPLPLPLSLQLPLPFSLPPPLHLESLQGRHWVLLPLQQQPPPPPRPLLLQEPRPRQMAGPTHPEPSVNVGALSGA